MQVGRPSDPGCHAGPPAAGKTTLALYVSMVSPLDRADIVVHNDEPLQPVWAVRTR